MIFARQYDIITIVCISSKIVHKLIEKHAIKKKALKHN